MAKRATQSKHTTSLIPIYVNLKLIDIQPRRRVSSQDIRSFVLKSLNRANDRDIDHFLDEYFDNGMKEGSWLFLFDSFDEIPAVLNSVESDNIINSYAEAIADFLGGLNACRGIIASREFRGPKHLNWPRFLVLPLSIPRQTALIKRFAMSSSLEQQVRGDLDAASTEIRQMSANPMFLALLCEHVRSGHAFPENAHALFERYVMSRLERDSDRMFRKYRIRPDILRTAAEAISFCMSADEQLGLSPTREALSAALPRHGFHLRVPMNQCFDALEYLKLARSEQRELPGESPFFTFAHRRFQEYFSTCALLKDSSRVSPKLLLSDGNWREAAVTLLQTQPLTVLTPILEEAHAFLVRSRLLLQESHKFEWPAGTLHLLSLLQDGFSGKLDTLPSEIRTEAGQILEAAFESNSRLDRKWALQAAGATSELVLLKLIREAMLSNSNWLREAAYRQVARLPKLPDDIKNWIHQSLVTSAISGQLLHERLSIISFLRRLDDSRRFLSAVRLLIWTPIIDACLLFLWINFFGFLGPSPRAQLGPAYLANFIVLLVAWAMLWHPPKVFRNAILAKGNLISSWSWMMRVSIIFIPLYMALHLGRVGLSFSLLIIFTIAWTPGALCSARFGKYTSLLLWPLQMFSPLLVFISDPLARGRQIVAWVRKTSEVFFPVVLAPFAFYIIEKNDAAWLKKINSFMAVIIWPAMGMGTLALGFVGVLWLKDYRVWRAVNRITPGSLTIENFVALLGGFGFDSFTRAYLRRIRTHDLLVDADKDLLEALFAIAYSAASTSQPLTDSKLQAASRIVKNSGATDEIWMLIEHVKIAEARMQSEKKAANA